jgi:DNA-binding MarR family transcriptional regulator
VGDDLDIGLRKLTGYQLRRASSATTPGVTRVLQAYGFRRSTYSALMVAIDNPGLKQASLADALAIERPNLVQIIDELESEGWVERRPFKEDRRAYALFATDEGRARGQAATDALFEYDAKLTRGLTSSEVQALARALHQIEENANQEETLDDNDLPRTRRRL